MPADTPLSPLDEPCTCFNLRRAARTVSREYDSKLKPLGLKTTQFSLLMAAEVRGGVSITEMAELLGMERTSLSRTLRPLEERGLVFVSEEGYKRTRSVEITEAGSALLEEGLPLWREAQNAMTEKIGRENVETLWALLARAAEATG